MKMQSISGRWTLAATSLLSLALAGGCCTKSGSAYSSSTPVGYSGGTEESETASAESTGETNTVIPLYKESVSVGTRQVDAGTVRVKKIVKTETVNQPVELRHEEVVIERQPAGSQTPSSDMNQAFQEQETVIHLSKDEPVIQKQTMPAGQVVVKKNSETQQQNIQTQVRSEDVVTVHQGTQGEATGGAESPGGQSTGNSGNSQ